jgi:pilus assembly protein Flp/PilA
MPTGFVLRIIITDRLHLGGRVFREGRTHLLKLSLPMIRWFRFDDNRGVTAIEYGLIAALVGLAIIVGVGLVGTNLNALFNNIGGQLVIPGG